MDFELVPVPDDKEWLCLQCAMNADRTTKAVVLLDDDDNPLGPIGMCGNHAEVMDLKDLKEAQRRFNEEVGLS